MDLLQFGGKVTYFPLNKTTYMYQIPIEMLPFLLRSIFLLHSAPYNNSANIMLLLFSGAKLHIISETTKLLMNNLQISPLYIKSVRAASHDAALT